MISFSFAYLSAIGGMSVVPPMAIAHLLPVCTKLPSPQVVEGSESTSCEGGVSYLLKEELGDPVTCFDHEGEVPWLARATRTSPQ
jgi:hypothetical protein